MAELVGMDCSLVYPYRSESTVFFITGIILALLTIALFYIAYKKNWSYWWVKLIKVILIIVTITLLGFGFLYYGVATSSCSI